MNQGDLVKFTFAKDSIILLQDGQKMYADITELELIRASR